MNVLGELKLMNRDKRPPCSWCKRGKLDLIEEKSDPIFGALGMTLSTLKCDAKECGKHTII
jgi:hypothetical protein